MDTLVLAVHFVSAVLLICVILLQRSEGGALSGLSGGNSVGGIMSTRGVANVLTKITALLAIVFMGTGLLLAALSSKNNKDTETIIQNIEQPSKSSVPLVK